MAGAALRWQAELPGTGPHSYAVTPDHSSLIVSEVGGVAYAAMRLRRYDLRTGALVATHRVRDHARAIAFDAGGRQAIAAFDKRLRLIDVETLEPQRVWDERIPRYADAAVWHDDLVLLKNSVHDQAYVFDLATGRHRRHRLGDLASPWPREDGRVIVLASDDERGAVWIFPSLRERPTRVLETPPFAAGVVDAEDRVWLAPGGRSVSSYEQVSRNIGLARIRPGPAPTTLEQHGLRDGSFEEHDLGFAFREMAVGAGELWLLHDGETAVERFGLTPFRRLGRFDAPAGHRVVERFPEAGVAIALEPLWKEHGARMACLDTSGSRSVAR